MSRSSSQYHGDFGPFDDDYRGFDASEDDGARGPLILALLLGVALIFGAVVWKTYSQGIRDNTDGLPIILADSKPYKEIPADPGGLIAPDQDRRIYDQLDGSRRVDGAPSSYNVEQVLQGGPPIELRPGQEADIDEVSGIPRAALEQIEALEAAAIADEGLPAAEEPAPSGVNTVSVPETPTLPVADPNTVTNSRFSAGGTFLVQVTALRSEAAANAAWTNLVSEAPALFANAERRIQRADLGAKGIFYRVRVGSFATRDDASAFCERLKGLGRDCIVVTG